MVWPGGNLLINLTIFFVSFVVTFVIMPGFIKKLHQQNFVVTDRYKYPVTKVATMGGLPMIVGILASVLIAFFIKPYPQERMLTYYFIIFPFFTFGLTDDILNISNRMKLIIPYFLALPIFFLNLDTTLTIGNIINLDLGIYYSLILAPLYVMVVANLVNMHSGYNGLAPGLSLILFFFVIYKTFLIGGTIVYMLPVVAALLAFFLFNKYPSQIFFGNSGSLMAGSALGAALVLNNIEIFGIILLTPHIINFLQYVYWLIIKEPLVKFGKSRPDGTLQVPNPYTLKWVLPYYYPMAEQAATLSMWMLSFIFGLLALMLV